MPAYFSVGIHSVCFVTQVSQDLKHEQSDMRYPAFFLYVAKHGGMLHKN